MQSVTPHGAKSEILGLGLLRLSREFWRQLANGLPLPQQLSNDAPTMELAMLVLITRPWLSEGASVSPSLLSKS